jgi:hypothetical protein
VDRPSVEQIGLARQILFPEPGFEHEPAEAVAQAGDKLRDRLGRIFSEMGVDALLRRAVHLAATDFPFLDEPGASNGLDGITALRTALQTREPGEAEAAAVTVFGHVFGLLARFIGEVLTMRVISEAWPETITDRPTRIVNEEQP